MPFTLTNAPSIFQRALDIALSKYKWQTCLVYIDDVIAFSKSVEDHINHLDDVLTLLSQAGISLKWKKCEFFHQHIKYLGHVIRPGKLEIDSTMTKALREARPPETVTQLRSF